MSNKIEQTIDGIEKMRGVLEIYCGFKLNYRPQSLQSLEEFLYRRGQQGEIPFEMLVILSIYFGETIRRNIKGAEWVDHELIDEVHLAISGGDGNIHAFPYRRIMKCTQDPTDGLYGYYAMLQDMNKGRLDLENLGDEFVEMPRGYALRAVQVPKELSKRFEDGEISKEEMYELAKQQQDDNEKGGH